MEIWFWIFECKRRVWLRSCAILAVLLVGWVKMWAFDGTDWEAMSQWDRTNSSKKTYSQFLTNVLILRNLAQRWIDRIINDDMRHRNMLWQRDFLIVSSRNKEFYQSQLLIKVELGAVRRVKLFPKKIHYNYEIVESKTCNELRREIAEATKAPIVYIGS